MAGRAAELVARNDQSQTGLILPHDAMGVRQDMRHLLGVEATLIGTSVVHCQSLGVAFCYLNQGEK